jgi:hypothetical protein
MRKGKVSGANEAFLLLAVCVGSAVFGLAVSNARKPAVPVRPVPGARAADGKVIRVYQDPKSPLGLSGLAVKGVTVTPDVEFSASSLAAVGGPGDWLQDLTLRLKNISDKQITYISLHLQFVDALDGGGQLILHDKHMGIGLLPRVPGDGQEPLALNPVESVKFVLSPQEIDRIKEKLAGRNLQVADMNKLAIKLGYVLFNDGIQWSEGSLYKPNPDAPHGWERISQ